MAEFTAAAEQARRLLAASPAAATVAWRDIFGQIMLGRLIREDPYDNFMWVFTLDSGNVFLWEGVGYLGTYLLKPQRFEPVVDAWRARFASPPATELGRSILGGAQLAVAGRERFGQALAALRARSSDPRLLRSSNWVEGRLPSPERLTGLLTLVRVRFAGRPSMLMRRGPDVLEFLKGKQLHSGIPPQIIGINTGAQVMLNLVKPGLPLPQPVAVDDNGQPRFATNGDYPWNKLYDAIVAIGLPTFIGSVFAARKAVGLLAKGRVALLIALGQAGFKLVSDLATDGHSRNGFDPTTDRAYAEQAWENLVELPTPDRVDKVAVHGLANLTDRVDQALPLRDRYLAKLVEPNPCGAPPDQQIRELEARIGADYGRVRKDDPAATPDLPPAAAEQAPHEAQPDPPEVTVLETSTVSDGGGNE
ncbi:MAG TPA: hypothetical protein VKG45_05385 [Actinomycetes bacterium]|nr:hypothetical protein [Actinomycetes bacterium]